MTIRLRLLIGFIILIIIFLISFFVNQRLSAEVVRNSDYLNRSESVIRNSNQIHKYMIDMQSGYRGYLLTGQPEFLSSFREGKKMIPGLMEEQHKLTSSRKQNERLDSISAIHTRWIEYAESVIQTRMDTLPESDSRYREMLDNKVKTGTGKRMNDAISNLFISFDSDEYDVRYQRRLKLQSSIASTTRINLTLTITSIILALISSFYIINIITRRISGMVKLADEISKGNFITIDDMGKDELSKLIESLNAMSGILDKNIQDLRQKNNELDQFAYVVSHDLKAPLRGIDNLTTWMEEDHGGELTPAIRDNLELIKGRTRRLENMINGLLEYARIGRVKIDKETVSVGELLHELQELLVPPNFEMKIEGNCPVLHTTKIHLEQVFSNLISNAVKYNDKPKGVITITCSEDTHHYLFAVADNGIGIQEAYFEKIFAIFQTLRERDAFESTGVGLAIVKRILDARKCKITVRSKPGEGTTFSFTWPKTENQ